MLEQNKYGPRLYPSDRYFFQTGDTVTDLQGRLATILGSNPRGEILVEYDNPQTAKSGEVYYRDWLIPDGLRKAMP